MSSVALHGAAAGSEPVGPAREQAAPAARGDDDPAVREAADRLERRRRAFGKLKDVAKQQGSVRVIVEMEIPQYTALRDAAVAARDAVASQQADAQVAQLVDVAARAELRPLAGTNHEVNHIYASVPFMALRVGDDALVILEASAGVVGIYEDSLSATTLGSTVNIIGATSAWSGGPDGSGYYVAVLDTGIRSSHNMFAGKHIVQACFALGQDGAGGAGDCPNGQAIDTASPDAARHHATSPFSYHGTHVTGIAVGNDLLRVPPLRGVAPGANIIAVQVFSQFRSYSGCPTPGSDCVLAWTSDVVRGLEHVYALRNTYNIACVNMSLGSGQYSNQTTCDNERAPDKAAIDNLRSVGIATIISSGNGSSCTGINGPACISSAVAVGAVSNGDVEADFSNFHSVLLDIYAPGDPVLSAWGTGNSVYAFWSGTSMAAPHVAGAWAVMKQALAGANVPTVLNALLARVRPVVGRCTPAPSMGRVHLGNIDCDGNGTPYVHETGPGRALQLDGVDDFARAAVAPLPVGSAPRTVECWFKRNSVPYNDDGLFTYGSLINGQSFGVLFSTLAPGRLRFQGFNADINGNLTVPMGVWNHLAVTYDGTTVRMYLNGALDVSSNLALNTASNETDGLQIGKRRDFLQQRFPGLIDEFCVWNYARTQAQIQAGMNRSRRGNEPGLVSYWRFDEWGGQVLYDLTLSNNHATRGNTSSDAGDDPRLVSSDAPVSNDCNSNGVSDECEPDCNFNGVPDDCDIASGDSPDCNANGTPDECEVGRSLQFDGANDLVRVRWPTALPVGNAPRTVEAWVYRNSSSSNQAIFVYGTPVSRQIFGLVISTNCPNKLYFYGHAADACGVSDLPVGTWTHVAVSWNGATLRLYMNGHLEYLGPPSPGTTLNTTLDSTGLTLGVRPGLAGSNWNGRIDEFRIWNYVRSQAQIQAGMLQPMSGAEPGLVGLWSFQETGGQFIVDQSASRSHGTLGATASAGSDDPVRTLFGAPFTGAVDCNANGLPDECEQDCNGNAIPDYCEPLPAGVRLVSAGASVGGDGTSWARPYRKLQDALAAAGASGGAITEIWVAAGTYRPDETNANPTGTGSRSATFQLINGVAIYGGFACGDADLSDRDPEANVTILSGDLAENDGPNFANYGENSFHVVTGSGTNATAILDGFTLTGGNANGTAGTNERNGGGLIILNGSPTVRNCRFIANTTELTGEGRGGGLYVLNNAPTIEDCYFEGNRAQNAGAIRVAGTASPMIFNCRFVANTANAAGGVQNTNPGGTTTISGCEFTGNTAPGFGGGAVFNQNGAGAIITGCTFEGNSGLCGGAIRNWTDTATPPIVTISGCTFLNNTATQSGGAIELFGGSNADVLDCAFVGNSATGALPHGGGAIHTTNGDLLVERCRFHGNTAIGDGGAIRSENGPYLVNLRNSVFSGNTAGRHGGALNMTVSNPPGTANVIGCTMTGNSTTTDQAGGAIHVGAGVLQVTNSIVWGNLGNSGSTIFVSMGFPPTSGTISYTNLQGASGSIAPVLGPGNINADPLFVDADGADNILGTADDDLHIPNWSPCVDRGDPAFVPQPGEKDIDGGDRVLGCRVDMGADETITGGSSTGDMNASGATDLADVALFVNALLHGGGSCAADINADGAVNGLDVQGFVGILVGS